MKKLKKNELINFFIKNLNNFIQTIAKKKKKNKK